MFFFLNQKGKKNPTKPIHTKHILWSHFSSCLAECWSCLVSRPTAPWLGLLRDNWGMTALWAGGAPGPPHDNQDLQSAA